MAIAKKVKYRREDREQLNLGVRVLVEAYGYSKKAKHRIDAVKRATKKLSTRERAELPEDNAIDGHLKTLIEYIEAGKCPTEYQRGCQIVIKDAYMEITKGQMSVNEIDAPEADEAVSVEAVCPQEDVAGQCDGKPEENEDKHDDDHDEFVHHMAVSHAAVVMAHLQMKCDSWHLEDKKVTMTLPFEEWYDICRHYGVSEEVAGWASLF